jgi:hypothetical protein
MAHADEIFCDSTAQIAQPRKFGYVQPHTRKRKNFDFLNNVN